ncbi:MAG: FAD-dependent oxidoreductase [Nocardioides sp.]|uniref:protoporphyrinogen/coproporphyrinogen oxidase n=1 Tax=Nocardioides sp. TaxID=35761 RepID=UPI0039E22091
MTTSTRRRVVVGGGLGGLAAAHFLARADPAAEVLVLEASSRAGGKLRIESVAGVGVDVGAEAMLNRRPEGVELARALGLDIVHPAIAQSQIWTRGVLRPLPRTLMGVPLDIDGLAASGVLSPEGLAAACRASAVPDLELDGDGSVGDLVAARFGDEVVDRLVEPLLGGVYAGHARAISARAAVPALIPMLTGRGGAPTGAPTYDAPVFAGIPGGMGLLPETLVHAGGFEVRCHTTVETIRPRAGGGFTLSWSSGSSGADTVGADHVVLATPAEPTARLLAELLPEVAADLAGVESASVVVVTFAFRAEDLPDLPGSGFLVPPIEGRQIKASTFSFNKWAWVRDSGKGAGPAGEDLAFLRTSLGRHGEVDVLERSDAELVAVSRAELAEAVGIVVEPVDTHVQRWPDGLPQYAVGHLDLVGRVRAGVAEVPGLAVCGATYDGVGIPAVIASGRAVTGVLCG